MDLSLLVGGRKRKTPRPRPFIPEVGDVDRVVYSRASVLDNGLIGKKPRARTELERDAALPPPFMTEINVYAMNTLQLKRTLPCEPLSVQVPMEYVYDSQPFPVRQKSCICMAGVWQVFSGRVSQASFERRARRIYEHYDNFWARIRESEYVFWPIEAAEGLFVTAIFKLRRGVVRGDEEGVRERAPENNVVEAWSIAEPFHIESSQRMVQRVESRIKFIFALEGITFRAGSYQSYEDPEGEAYGAPWTPPQWDLFSSGIRSFELVRQLLGRITDFHCNEQSYDSSFFDEPTRGYINCDRVRLEMVGMCAWGAIKDMNWGARIGIEMIQRITTVRGMGEFNADKLAEKRRYWRSYYPTVDRLAENPNRGQPPPPVGVDDDDSDYE
ncbi:hypothetical protein F5Y15DRAFT_380141 [Xylariaceae sp. FL0016]|nr:hypothetical protein F5Y15DRAFT_380141 [Xylariaceae sp. FL0016]